jgi:aldose 1-epimerase
MPFRVRTETIAGRDVLHLHDDASGASASVVPSLGFNLFDLRLPAAGAARPILASAPDFVANPVKPTRNGTPVLFPFPNRVRDARYTFGGKDYQLPVNSAPNAIHGFATVAAWDVTEHKADDAGARVTGRFQISKQAPDKLPHWPADAVLEMRYTLAGRRLTLDVTVANPTAEDLPFGFGIHPYFRLPFGGGDPARTSVVLPAAEYWPLKDSLPTGQRLPVDDRLDFRDGRPMPGLKLDDVLTGLPRDGGVCRLVDQALGAEFRIEFDRHFRELVVFTPPWFEDVIAVEPYTQATDAINLATKGIDGGLRVLKHGEEARMTLVMETRG